MKAQALVSLLSGVLFGAGLLVSGMTDPAKVVAFLDLAGAWDPSLAFVMGGAIGITLPVFQWVNRSSSRPLLGKTFHLPTRRDLDAPLIGGAVLFGIGWGVAGLCPGPAIANLYTLTPQAVAFVVAMLVGMWLYDRLASRPPSPRSRSAAT